MRSATCLEVEFLGVKIIAKKGSITQEEVDAIMSHVNSYLHMSGGVILEEEALRRRLFP